MSEQGHRYTFHGFPGSYWEAKERREAMERLVELSEELGLYDEEFLEKSQEIAEELAEEWLSYDPPKDSGD